LIEMLPLWASIMLGLGIPGILFSVWRLLRHRNREITALLEEMRLNIRLLEALLDIVHRGSFRNRNGILDFAGLDHRVTFYYTRYRSLLPFSALPAGLISDVLLFYEKLERLEDFCARLAEGEDVGARVRLNPPGPMPMTRRRLAAWEIQVIANTNKERGESVISQLTTRRAIMLLRSLVEHLKKTYLTKNSRGKKPLHM